MPSAGLAENGVQQETDRSPSYFPNKNIVPFHPELFQKAPMPCYTGGTPTENHATVIEKWPPERKDAWRTQIGAPAFWILSISPWINLLRPGTGLPAHCPRQGCAGRGTVRGYLQPRPSVGTRAGSHIHEPICFGAVHPGKQKRVGITGEPRIHYDFNQHHHCHTG